MASRPKNRLRNFLEESARNTLIQFIGLMFSTALVGGAGYLLFSAQSEADDINRLIVDAEKQTAEAKTFYDLTKVPSEGWFANSANYEQIQNIVLYLGANKFKDKLDSSFASNALDVCNSASIQLNSEKGQIDGFSAQDDLVKNQQQRFLAEYDNEIALVEETSGIIINWEKETADDRDKRYSLLSS